MSVLSKVNPLFERFTDPTPGDRYIYSLISKGDVVYIGQSKDLKTRVYSHLIDGKVFDQIEYYECTESEANELEANAIVRESPKLNTSLPKTKLYINENQLKKEISDCISDVVTYIAKKSCICFTRPPSKKISHTYVAKSELDEIIEKVKSALHELTKEG